MNYVAWNFGDFNNATRHFCADCRRGWKCPNPEGRVDARVLNNRTYFEGRV